MPTRSIDCVAGCFADCVAVDHVATASAVSACTAIDHVGRRCAAPLAEAAGQRRGFRMMAAGVLLAGALWGCDSRTLAPVPEALDGWIHPAETGQRPYWRLAPDTALHVAVPDPGDRELGDAPWTVAAATARAAARSFVTVRRGTQPEPVAGALATARLEGAAILVYPALSTESPPAGWTAQGGREWLATGQPPDQALVLWVFDVEAGQVLQRFDVRLRNAPVGNRPPQPVDLERTLTTLFADLAADRAAPTAWMAGHWAPWLR